MGFNSVFKGLSYYSKEYKTYVETFYKWRSLVYYLQYGLGL
jgi:hypothetical protein